VLRIFFYIELIHICTPIRREFIFEPAGFFFFTYAHRDALAIRVMALLGANSKNVSVCVSVRKIGADEFLLRFGRRVILKFVDKNLF